MNNFLVQNWRASACLSVLACSVLAAVGQGVAVRNPLAPIGHAQGVRPGRVVWVHNPEAAAWQGPGRGHWWQPENTRQDEVDRMMSRAIRDLAGEATEARAWDQLLRWFNRSHGKGDLGYKPGEKIAVKVNFVGFIWRIDAVNPETYNLEKQRDYMNTSPQMILALLRQLTGTVGVRQEDIALGDPLALFANEYYEMLAREFPHVRYVDHLGKFGRAKAQFSSAGLYWSSRPQVSKPDFIADFLADADYQINLANLKAHTGAGVTLCAKNHYGSLVRWPVEPGYYDLHPSGFSKDEKSFRVLVDLMGHSQLGGKTLLYLVDGLYPGVHPRESVPKPWKSAPFNGHWASSLLASQDPVAIDSVGLDFLAAEYSDHPRRSGVDDYLHEAALANNPPSGTFYDPNHPTAQQRLPSLGVHEHWNSSEEKKYSRNLGKTTGIELIPALLGGTDRHSTAATRPTALAR